MLTPFGPPSTHSGADLITSCVIGSLSPSRTRKGDGGRGERSHSPFFLSSASFLFLFSLFRTALIGHTANACLLLHLFDRRRPLAGAVRRPDGSAAKRGLRYGVATTYMRQTRTSQKGWKYVMMCMNDRFANCDQRPIASLVGNARLYVA